MTTRATPPPSLTDLAPVKRPSLLETMKMQVAARPKLAGIYLAGKISKNDWRHDLCGLRGATDYPGPGEMPADWEPIESLIPGIWVTGPFFTSCDHGCAHGTSSHGQYGGCTEPPDDQTWFIRPPLNEDSPFADDHPLPGRKWRRRTTELCLRTIDESNGVYVWLDADDAHGALVEIGYAIGMGKPIMIDGPDWHGDAFKPHWFPFHIDGPNITRGPGVNPHLGFTKFAAQFLNNAR